MVFSTVQISMPGTSWAKSCDGINVRAANAAVIIEILTLTKSLLEIEPSHQFALNRHM